MGPLDNLAFCIVIYASIASCQIIYSIRDSKMIQHQIRRYYDGPGATMHVKYSRFVPANVNVEVYADDCQIASIYRNTEGGLAIPPGAEEVSFIRRDGVCIGKTKIIPGQSDHIYIYFDRILPEAYGMIVSGEYPDVDDDAEERLYSEFIKEVNEMDRFNLVIGLLCSIGPIVFKLLV